MSRPLTPEDFETIKKQWQKEVRARILTATLTPSDSPDILELIDQVLLAVGSERRLSLLLDLIRRRPSRIFWPVFLKWWAVCDDTWMWRNDLLRYLRRHHANDSGPNYLQGDDRDFFESLMDPIEVFRGCSRPRVRAISWTLLPGTASEFARGHRGIPVPDPVVARAWVPKDAVFAVFNERSESEILLDPRRLVVLVANGWQP